MSLRTSARSMALRALVGSASLAMTAGVADADHVFYGLRNTQQIGVAPSGDPLSARDAFLAHFTGYYLADFENVSVGAVGSSLDLNPTLVGGPAVLPTPQATVQRDAAGKVDIVGKTVNGGYATSGTRYLWTQTALTIDLSPDPQRGFGFYATDIDDRGGEVAVTWDDGHTDQYLLGKNGGNLANGNLMFFGVIGDLASSISKVSFTGANDTDGFRIDDLLFAFDSQVAVAAPAPTAAVGGLILWGALGVVKYRRRSRQGS